MSSGIILLKDALSDVAEVGNLTMRYEDGGRVEVFRIGGVDVRLPAGLRDQAGAIRQILAAQCRAGNSVTTA